MEVCVCGGGEHPYHKHIFQIAFNSDNSPPQTIVMPPV